MTPIDISRIQPGGLITLIRLHPNPLELIGAVATAREHPLSVEEQGDMVYGEIARQLTKDGVVTPDFYMIARETRQVVKDNAPRTDYASTRVALLIVYLKHGKQAEAERLEGETIRRLRPRIGPRGVMP